MGHDDNYCDQGGDGYHGHHHHHHHTHDDCDCDCNVLMMTMVITRQDRILSYKLFVQLQPVNHLLIELSTFILVLVLYVDDIC